MGYTIEDFSGGASDLEEAASFLASFTADGEGPSALPEDCLPEQWKKRLSWWWDQNPYCGDNSPRALLLRDENGEIVGFFGFVPHDYVCDGQRVPSLIFTTTFVRQSSRNAVLGLWMRAHRMRDRFHLVDGGPNPEVQQLLSKTGYRCAEPARLHFFPIRKRLNGLRPLALRAVRLFTPRNGPPSEAGRIVTSPDEVESIPPTSRPHLRKHVDLDSIRWYLETGSKAKHFVGWVDDSGALLAYFIGVVRVKKGIRFFFVIDGDSFAPEEDALLYALASHAARDPETAGLPEEAEILSLPLDAATSADRKHPGTMEYKSRVFYQLPRQFESTPRDCRPWEGDHFLH